MIPPVVVPFQVGGIADVKTAIGSIQASLAKAELEAQQTAKQGATQRSRTADTERRDREKMYGDLFRQLDKREKDAVQAAEKAAKDKARAAEQGARETVAAQKRADAELKAARDAALREFESDEKKKLSIAERYIKQRENAEKAANKRLAAMISGATTRGITHGTNFLVRGGMRMANEALTLGGGFSIADSVQREMSLDLAARQISNSAYIPGTTARPDIGAIKNQIKATSISSGIGEDELARGMHAYVAKASDFPGAQANMGFFAKIAAATATDFEDVTRAAGMLKVQNKNLSDEDTRKLLLSVVMQGKQGAVEMQDLARVAGSVTKTSAAYGMNQTEAQRQLLGLSQIAIRTAQSPEEAATIISNFANDTLKHQKTMRNQHGVQTTDARGNLLPPEEILANVFKKTGGNIGKIQELGYGARSIRLFEALAPSYREGGEEGMRKGIRSLTGANYDAGDLEKDFQTILEAPERQLGIEFDKLRIAVGQQLLPEVVKLIPVIREAVPQFVKIVESGEKLVEWFSRNPFVGLGSVVSAFVLKELAVAAIGSTIENGILTIFGGIGPGGAGNLGSGIPNAVTATGGVTKTLGAVATIGGTAVGATMLGMAAIDYVAEKGVEGQQKHHTFDAKARNAISQLREKAANGTLTQQDIHDAQGFVGAFKQDVGERTGSSASDRTLAGFGVPWAQDKVAADDETLQRGQQGLEAFIKALLESVEALRKLDWKSMEDPGGPQPFSAVPPGSFSANPNQNGPMSGQPRDH